MSPRHYTFTEKNDCYDAATTAIVTALQTAIETRGKALLAVSGGKSPQALFTQLSNADLAWEKVTITLVDERYVEPHHTDSNEALVRQFLLTGKASVAQFVPLWSTAESIEACVASAELRLSKLNLPFDVVLLGMGDDGHTASWFAGAPELSSLLDLHNRHLCGVCHPPQTAYARLTLTAAAVLKSRQIVLLVVGAQKKETLALALQHPDPISDLPVRLPLHQKEVPVCIYSCG